MPLAVLLTLLSALGLAGGLLAPALGLPAPVQNAAWALSYAAGGWLGVRAAASELARGRIDIDLLMVLAALGALVIGAPFEGAMLLFLFSLSNVLQDFAIGRSRRAIEALMGLRPDTARVRRGDEIVEVPVEEVEPGAIYLLRPGDRVPLDGEVVSGGGEVDQASLTGESVPVSKGPGDPLFGGTINGSGSLEVRVTRPASDSAIARMIALVEDAQEEKAETQQLLERFEQPYALGVIALTIAAVAVPMLLVGEAFEPAFYRAMTLMVAASPCALIISTPAAVLSAIAAGARQGVLFKGGVFVESLATVRAVAFDKTGTLTRGETALVAIRPAAGGDEAEILRAVATLQSRSEHHLARATVRAARERGLPVGEPLDFRALPGRGVTGRVDGRTLHVGNARLLSEVADSAQASLGTDGATTEVAVVETGEDGPHLLGVLAYADTLRPGAAEAVARLREVGIEHTVVVTGDARPVGETIAREAGIAEVFAEVLPEEKVGRVRELLARYGSVAMVGDGVNDAPALATASVGIAMGGVGTDVAMETADVVLMADDLEKLPWAFELSRRARRILIANLVVALAVIAVMIGFILTVGLPLPIAVVGHEGSTVLVSLNGLRLLLERPD